MNEELHCPRCKNNKIIDYGDTFDCLVCKLEFDKKDLELYDDESAILSIEEKLDIVKVLKSNSDKIE